MQDKQLLNRNEKRANLLSFSACLVASRCLLFLLSSLVSSMLTVAAAGIYSFVCFCCFGVCFVRPEWIMMYEFCWVVTIFFAESNIVWGCLALSMCQMKFIYEGVMYLFAGDW